MFQKLRRQLTAVCAVSTGLVLTGMAVAALLFTTSVLEEQAEKTFATDVNSVFYYLNSQSYIDQTWLTKTEANNGLILRINVRNNDLMHTNHDLIRAELTEQAREYARTELGFDDRSPPSSAAEPDMVNFLLHSSGKEYRAVVATVSYGSEWLGVTILKDTAPEKTLALRVCLVTVACLLIALILLSLFAHYFIGYTLKPVEEAGKRQTEFVSAASHELRSPLAVMSASAGVIKKGTLEDAKEYAEKIEEECTRLSRLTGDLLRLASADSDCWTMRVTEVDPETIVIGLAERFEELAAHHGIKLKVELQDIIFPAIQVDEQRIEQALAILIDNALGYTPAGGTVSLGVSIRRRSVYFSVTDNGPGVPDEEKEKIFDRFYRGDKSRTDKEHFGIGLSIAREIALLHKGSLSVRDAAGGGSKFILKIPF